MSSSESGSALLVAKDAVSDVIRRYAYGIDTRNDEMVRSCFDRNATIEGTMFSGGLEDYLPRLLSTVRSYGATMHQLGTQLIEVGADTATAQNYVIAYHFRDLAGTEEDLVVGVRYRDRLNRGVDGRWRIVERSVVPMWRRGRLPVEESQ